ncbi:MAG TPA: hypothetical protein VFW64_00975 [Pseudonocardiaceae bacterium]|nr:hypothetical protein [Pseudonocardiaceae bacterium]
MAVRLRARRKFIATLESVMKQNPNHPGANHYYIHVMEASPHPEKALVCAERLKGMMPAAGHLQHMPAHIMQRVGRYEDAAEANREGAAADTAYYARAKPLDYYTMYTGHNYQYLALDSDGGPQSRDAGSRAQSTRDHPGRDAG